MTDSTTMSDFSAHPQPTADLSGALLPTEATLRRRQSIPFQLGRFVVFNLRMIRLVLKGGH
ncbi:MAG: hypothetical protein Q4P15_06720 [Propionibacteriaceae bacterium]|nr:hypothetical protein [Propionibacteriaceae bacterium]